ncbi:MAG TPA: tetratricopeptide repeat protein [Verrucomicrobiae bacterium]|nr:tetratricopeptide repeat protein [Verrucomicrobiae bacterium]
MKISRRLPAAALGALAAGLLIALPRLEAVEKKSAAQTALEKRQRVELLGFFLKDPKDAKLPQTPLAIELYNQGVELYERHEYDMALTAFEDSLKYDPNNALAYELMGDIHYFQQKLPEAKKEYQKAFELQPRDTLKKKLEKLRDETLVEKDMSSYNERHFIIKYHGEEDAYDGFQVRELLRTTYEDLSKDFGYYFKHKVVVLMYDEDEFKNLTKLPHWAAGVYDGKIRMPAYKKGFSPKELKALTAHEMTHAFVADISQSRAPAWINEGLAEFEEDKVQKNPLLMFKSAAHGGKLIPMDQLLSHGGALSLQDPVAINLFYEQSFQVVSYLINRYGMFRVKQVLEEMAKGKNSDEALREVLRISTSRLEQEWKETL